MWIQNTNRKSSKNKRKITIESQYNDTLFNLLLFFLPEILPYGYTSASIASFPFLVAWGSPLMRNLP